MRTLAIGDIHSGLRALQQVLEKANVTTEDHLIFLGDYVDGWSDASETISFLIALNTTHNCTFIRGNHDELCRAWLEEGKDNPQWFQHGGEATMNSYLKLDDKTKQLHIGFYTSLENYFLDDKNRLFLHAGFTNLKGVEFEYFKKTFYWDRTLWEMVLCLNSKLATEDPFYPKRLLNYSEIYIGHTPVTRIGKTTPQNAGNVWNIDTGAAFKGPLSIINVDTKEVWQSDPVYTFYSDEKGRN
ncbi:metallophosphoesterase [Cellulophaga baltica]|uniref:metallophosphoesterase n=1 Tax=Cellulophaga TaxID=104264 RepID=UPI001C071A42|nr:MULTISPECIES: metallophosphoesterase [Cellulophaga]MBU2995730.1 metallophosphoesterase [Cellulophaga baltica]MDO6767124.1 metallophosphoesterase [Cellulophaga sp. 1_MG-2023]